MEFTNCPECSNRSWAKTKVLIEPHSNIPETWCFNTLRTCSRCFTPPRARRPTRECLSVTRASASPGRCVLPECCGAADDFPFYASNGKFTSATTQRPTSARVCSGGRGTREHMRTPFQNRLVRYLHMYTSSTTHICADGSRRRAQRTRVHLTLARQSSGAANRAAAAGGGCW